MPRLLFEKKGSAVWISHLDLMRLFQRAFKRAGLPLKHTQGYNPRPYVAVALPLSVGAESCCELLDFDLDGEPFSADIIRDRLNDALVEGVRVLDVYEGGRKIRDLAFMDCAVLLEYDDGIPTGAHARITELFSSGSVTVEKMSKNGPSEQNIAPMIQRLSVSCTDAHTLVIRARICCQNPSLNPMLIAAAVKKYLPGVPPDFARCARLEIYDGENTVFR